VAGSATVIEFGSGPRLDDRRHAGKAAVAVKPIGLTADSHLALLNATVALVSVGGGVAGEQTNRIRQPFILLAREARA
jgi:hypothetical protein